MAKLCEWCKNYQKFITKVFKKERVGCIRHESVDKQLNMRCRHFCPKSELLALLRDRDSQIRFFHEHSDIHIKTRYAFFRRLKITKLPKI